MIQPLHTLTRFGLVARARPDGNDLVQKVLDALHEDLGVYQVQVSQGRVLVTRGLRRGDVRNAVTRLLGGSAAEEFIKSVQSGDADGRTSQVVPAIQLPPATQTGRVDLSVISASSFFDLMNLNDRVPRIVFDTVVKRITLNVRDPVDGDLIFIEFSDVRFGKRGQYRCGAISIGPSPSELVERFGSHRLGHQAEILVEYYRGDWVIREQFVRYVASPNIGVAALAAVLIKEWNFKRDGKGFPKNVIVYPSGDSHAELRREIVRIMESAPVVQDLPDPRFNRPLT